MKVMKNIVSNIKRAFVAMVLVAFAVSTQAQALRTGYFLDGNIYRHRLNPALQSARGHYSLPILGGIQIGTMGNFGVGNFLYESPTNSDELVTFMHESVSAKDFLGELDSENIMRLDLDFTILSVAFRAFGGYNTIDLTLRSHVGMNLPYGMFEFMKDQSKSSYSFSDVAMRSRNYADLSLGHSRNIDESLTVGGRLKFLFGLAYGNVNFEKMKVNMSGDMWEISARGNADIALGGAYTLSDELTTTGKTLVDGYDDVKVGLHGFGMGVDLGASYDFSNLGVKGLTASASITDLGYISWSKAARAAISPEDKFQFDGFENMSIHGPEDGEVDYTLDEQFEDLSDELEDFFALEDKGEGSVSGGIGAKFNLGVEYKMPFYDKLSAGFLYTHCFDDVFSYNQASFMVNISPLRVLDFAASATFSDYGTGLGAMANIHCTGFNFFIGTDCFLGKVGKQFVPVEDMNASVSFGINVTFGHRDKKKNK